MSRRRSRRENAVPADVVQATLASAERLGRDVADVPIVVIAHALGVSRSTLLRQLGGTRRPLDDAVRDSGVDPGGRPPVRLRAVAAAAALISEEGVGAASFEAVAARADCSVHSLYAVFAGREELLQAVYDRYMPSLDIDDVVSGSPADLRGTVLRIYQWFAEVLLQQPRVVVAVLADALARPADSSARVLADQGALLMLSTLDRWLEREVDAGRIRDLPRALLIQQLISPISVHCMLRAGSARQGADLALPALDECCEVFTEAFLRSVAT
ncbi:TetR/AcrR family transcriptional regulator [Mycobacterium kubicae]|uniref:TetR/AcrR family transcriptional regulator n=1 Tax=Mycobacterium kubicae TaxID=120959 RepID=UPI0007FDB1A5|nr:hypothetical protein A5725_18415 [Mycobacterium kubicae]OBK44701.1 hypothetical protein A5657_04195 [Mycobacterium kubicae]ORW00669.1 hypothetical protein AWC13_07585 [Mycobacterium kubicae]QNI05008.1 TetR/AcrR family transcriptional regulator [Mycobacterium kubicae]QNI09994.1 TetR/AcrR family transcriptional regulator [Mycobacterium kubicae]